MKIRNFIYIVSPVLLLVLFAQCAMPERDNAADRKSEDYTVIVEVLSPDPDTGSLVMGFEDIQILFSDPMDTASLAVTGDFAGQYTASWSETNFTNDTLTLSPVSGSVWANSTVDGAAQTLTLTAESNNGISTDAENFDFVLRNAITVSEAGNDSNPGTVDEPLATIAAAITLADSTYSSSSAVLVGVGDYTVSNAITMINDISVYGDFTANFSSRNAAGTSTITDSRQSDGTDPYAPNSVFNCGSGIGRSTVIDGFVINAGAGTNCTAIYLYENSAPTISNNTINGGGSDTTESSSTIKITTASPLIRGNTITFGNVTDSIAYAQIAIEIEENDSYDADMDIEIIENTIGNINSNTDDNSYAVYIWGLSMEAADKIVFSSNIINGGYSDEVSMGFYVILVPSELLILNNYIYSGGGSPTSYGINIMSTSAVIRNNTILFGDNTTSSTNYGIYLSTSTPYITNNILCSAKVSNTHPSYCIFESDGSSSPLELHSNCFYNLESSNNSYEMYFNNNTSGYADIDYLNTNEPNALSNTDENPFLSDPNGDDNLYHTMEDNSWSLSDSTSSDIYEGAEYNSGWEYQADITGESRTVPWSIGAYEYD